MSDIFRTAKGEAAGVSESSNSRAPLFPVSSTSSPSSRPAATLDTNEPPPLALQVKSGISQAPKILRSTTIATVKTSEAGAPLTTEATQSITADESIAAIPAKLSEDHSLPAGQSSANNKSFSVDRTSLAGVDVRSLSPDGGMDEAAKIVTQDLEAAATENSITEITRPQQTQFQQDGSSGRVHQPTSAVSPAADEPISGITASSLPSTSITLPRMQSGEMESNSALSVGGYSGDRFEDDDLVFTNSSPVSSTLSPKARYDAPEPLLTGRSDLDGTPNPLQQSGAGTSIGKPKGAPADVETAAAQSPAQKLTQETGVPFSEPGAHVDASVIRNSQTSRIISPRRPEALSSIPESLVSPKPAASMDRIANPAESAGRRETVAVPINHPDTKGRSEKGQDSEIQGTAKSGSAVLRETAKSESEAGSGRNQQANEQIQPQEKIVETASVTDGSRSNPGSGGRSRNQVRIGADGDTGDRGEDRSCPGDTGRTSCQNDEPARRIHNSQFTMPRQEPGVQSDAAPLPVQSGMTHGSMEQSIMDQVSKNLALNFNGSSPEVRITMKPESLGEVVMKVKMDDGKVSAQINVNNVNVKAVLDANVSQLRDTLLSKGIEIQHIDIVADGQSAYGRPSGQNRPKQKSQQRGALELDPLGQYEPLRTMGYNTIELTM